MRKRTIFCLVLLCISCSLLIGCSGNAKRLVSDDVAKKALEATDEIGKYKDEKDTPAPEAKDEKKDGDKEDKKNKEEINFVKASFDQREGIKASCVDILEKTVSKGTTVDNILSELKKDKFGIVKEIETEKEAPAIKKAGEYSVVYKVTVYKNGLESVIDSLKKSVYPEVYIHEENDELLYLLFEGKIIVKESEPTTAPEAQIEEDVEDQNETNQSSVNNDYQNDYVQPHPVQPQPVQPQPEQPQPEQPQPIQPQPEQPQPEQPQPEQPEEVPDLPPSVEPVNPGGLEVPDIGDPDIIPVDPEA